MVDRNLFIPDLPLPIEIKETWIDRHFYWIKLSENIDFGNFPIYKTKYLVKFKNLENLSYEQFLQAFQWILHDLLYNVRNNTAVKVGQFRPKICLDSVTLRNSINA